MLFSVEKWPAGYVKKLDARLSTPPLLGELREVVLEQAGEDQTDRPRHALSDAVKALSMTRMKFALRATRLANGSNTKPGAWPGSLLRRV